MVTVTNLPSRPTPVLARALSSLSALSGGRIVVYNFGGGIAASAGLILTPDDGSRARAARPG